MKYWLSSSLFLFALAPNLAAAQDAPDAGSPVSEKRPCNCPCADAAKTTLPPPMHMRSSGLVGGGAAAILGALITTAGGVGLWAAASMEGSCGAVGPCGTQPTPALQGLGIGIAVAGVGSLPIGIWMIAKGGASVPDDARPAKVGVIDPFVRPGPGGVAAGFHF